MEREYGNQLNMPRAEAERRAQARLDPGIPTVSSLFLSLCTALHRVGFISAARPGLIPYQPRLPAEREPHFPRTASRRGALGHMTAPAKPSGQEDGQAWITRSSTTEDGEPRDLGSKEEGPGGGRLGRCEQ